MLTIAISVLIDRADKQHDRRQLKKRLIWGMSSEDQALAVRAAKELRDAGWLVDGSLKGADLSSANLQRAQLGNACLEEVELRDSKLDWVNLESANLRKANLTGVTAEKPNFRNAQLHGAVLRGAKLPRAILEDIEADGGIDLLGASLVQANLRGANLKDARLEDCDFCEADLTGSDLTGAQLLRVNIEGAVLDDVILERADLSELVGWKMAKSIAGARISGVRNAPEGFREWAVEHGAIKSIPGRESPQGKLVRPRFPSQNSDSY